jgi:hypothetical protein
MTWIVAKQFLGYVAFFSDVQVSWNKGKLRKDCLKGKKGQVFDL